LLIRTGGDGGGVGGDDDGKVSYSLPSSSSRWSVDLIIKQSNLSLRRSPSLSRVSSGCIFLRALMVARLIYDPWPVVCCVITHRHYLLIVLCVPGEKKASAFY